MKCEVKRGKEVNNRIKKKREKSYRTDDGWIRFFIS